MYIYKHTAHIYTVCLVSGNEPKEEKTETKKTRAHRLALAGWGVGVGVFLLDIWITIAHNST